MSKLLYIKASPRGERSYSIRAAEAFVAAYQAAHPKDAVEVLDLFRAELAEFGAAAAEGKYAVMSGKEGSEDSKRAWKKVIAAAEHFKGFDKYVLAVPMWNFGLPWRLKLYLDTVIQPGLTFTVTDAGYQGLVKGKKALTVYSSGGQYAGEAAGIDHQKPHLEFLLRFMGIEDRKQLVVDGTLAEGADGRLAEAVAKAKEMARDW